MRGGLSVDEPPDFLYIQPWQRDVSEFRSTIPSSIAVAGDRIDSQCKVCFLIAAKERGTPA
jgi:hypothetical protein